MAWLDRLNPLSRRGSAAPKVDDDLFDDEFQRKLDYLAIVSRKVFAGRMRADRRTKKSGSGVEFADHRDYQPGDDFRYLDWNVYQRFERLLLRLYEEEEDLSIYLIVDASGSMAFDEGRKLKYAKKVCAALAYVGLANLDRVSIVSTSDRVMDRMPQTRGKARIFKVFRFLRELEPAGVTNLEDALKGFVAQNKRRGLAVLISDLYDPAGFERGINVLRYNKFDPFVVHVTDPAEARPKLHGDVLLYDCETGDEREVTVTAKVLSRFAEVHGEYMAEIDRFCATRQVPYIAADVQVPFDELILRVFRRGASSGNHVLFAGLPFAQLAAVFAVAAAAVVALYILKLRRRTVAIPFSPLWQRILKDKEATSLFSKLKRLLSLLLQLALLALLVVALGDPRAAATLLKGRNLVVLIDASASMQATDVPPDRLGAAKEEVKTMIRGLGGADRMLIAQMDAMVTPLGPMSGDTSELDRALDQLRPTDARADFPRALRFATDTLRGVENTEIVVVSDGNLGEASDASGPVHLGGAKLSFVRVGKGKRNVGITEFAVRRYPLDKSRYEVMLEVTNTGDQQEDIELKLLGDGMPVDLTHLRLQPGERLPRFYPNLSGASRKLEADIAPLDGTHDDLPADDHAFALLPERRRAKVLVVTSGNTYLEAALLLDEYLDVAQVSPADYVKKYPSGATGFDTVLFDGATPMEMPRANAIYLDPRGPGSPVKVEGEITQPGFDRIDRRHPIVRFTALDDVNIARGHKLVPEAGDKVVGASTEGPILVAGTRAGHKFVAMGFDIRDSDFPLRVAWPLFLLDTINWFVDEDSTYLSSFRTGDVWRVPVGTEATQATLKSPDGETTPVPVHEGRAVYLGERAGFYELSVPETRAAASDAPSPSPITAFAANLLDSRESAIGPVDKLVVDGKEAGSLEGFHVGVRRELWIYLLLAAALLTAIEWATYHRRITV